MKLQYQKEIVETESLENPELATSETSKDDPGEILRQALVGFRRISLYRGTLFLQGS